MGRWFYAPWGAGDRDTSRTGYVRDNKASKLVRLKQGVNVISFNYYEYSRFESLTANINALEKKKFFKKSLCSFAQNTNNLTWNA